jgi:hypothetical protein
MYNVLTKSMTGEPQVHSQHESYREAIDQADMIQGEVENNKLAYKWASYNQGFLGTYEDWCGLDDDEREEYEIGAGKGR